MLKTEERTIDGLTIKVTQFAGRRNFALLIDLAKVIGPTLAAAGDAVMKSGSVDDLMNADISIDRIGQALFASLDKATVMKLVDDLLASTYVDDRPMADKFDEVFAGPHMMRLPKVLTFVIEANFGNFTELAANVSKVGGGKAAGKA